MLARSCCLDSSIGLRVLEQVWTYKQLGTERVESDEKDIIKTRKARDRGNKTHASITAASSLGVITVSTGTMNYANA